jgi:hypothetical protein
MSIYNIDDKEWVTELVPADLIQKFQTFPVQ